MHKRRIKPAEHSQIAKFKYTPVPDYSSLGGPDGPAKAIKKMLVMAKSAEMRRTIALHSEIATCFQVARYLNTHPDRWPDFCASFGFESKARMPSDKILYEVLKTYTGIDNDGLKKASRYYRAVRPLFTSGKSGAKAYQLLRKLGVHGLLQKKAPSSRRASKAPKAIQINVSATKSGIVRAGVKQTIFIKLVRDCKFRLSFDPL